MENFGDAASISGSAPPSLHQKGLVADARAPRQKLKLKLNSIRDAIVFKLFRNRILDINWFVHKLKPNLYEIRWARDCALVGRLARSERGNARIWAAFRPWRERFAFSSLRRRVSTHRRAAFRNGHLTNIIGESKGRLTIRDDACSHGAAVKKRKTLAPRPTRSPTPCIPPLKSRQTSNERAIARSSRGGGGRFPDCLRVRKCVPGTKSWWAKCVARGAMCVAL